MRTERTFRGRCRTIAVLHLRFLHFVVLHLRFLHSVVSQLRVLHVVVLHLRFLQVGALHLRVLKNNCAVLHLRFLQSAVLQLRFLHFRKYRFGPRVQCIYMACECQVAHNCSSNQPSLAYFRRAFIENL